MNNRNILAFLFVALLSTQSMAQIVERNDWESLQISYEVPQLQIGSASLFGTQFATLTLENYLSCNRPGQPDLPVLSSMVEIPLCEGIDLEISDIIADTILGPKLLVAPCQPSRSKSDSNEATLKIDNTLYNTDAFTDGDLCKVIPVGVARSINLAQVLFAPVRYNPARNQLIVVRHATLTLRYRQVDREGTLKMKELHTSPAFNPGIAPLNTLPSTKSILTSQQAPIHYLIVAHSMFRGQLDNFIAWKRRKGYLVTVGYTDQATVGSTTTSIQNYIKSFYTNASASLPAPTYLLLVGDKDQVPAFAGQYDHSGASSSVSHISDLYYATWTAGDMIPDCHYGRFSANTISQLTPQVEKTLMYEQYTFADPSFLSRGILIAGVDNGSTSDNGYRFGDPAMDYAAREYINSSHGYSTIYYYKNNTSFAPAGVTVTGSNQGCAATLKNLYNQGAGWINYTAHGGETSWANPSFTTTDANAMTNTQKFGIMIGNCCVSGSYQISECLGEALLRKGNYCGAVDYIGASNNTYWYEDFYWGVGLRNSSSITNTMNTPYDSQNKGMYDCLFHTHNESISDHYTSTGAMLMAGNMAVQSSTSSGKNYYWEIYHNFGDPSLMPWLGQAQQMAVTVNNAVPMGTAALSLHAVPYAYCAITDGQGNLRAATYADASGNASLSLAQVQNPGIYELAVSAQNYRTHFSEINFFVANGPYILAAELTARGLEADHETTFGLLLKNVGNANAETISVILSSDDGRLLVRDSVSLVESLAAGDSIMIDSAFSGIVRPDIVDQSMLSLTVNTSWSNGSMNNAERTFHLEGNAPDIQLIAGQVTGTVAPGNTVTLSLTCRNQGQATAQAQPCALVCIDPSVEVLGGSDTLGNIASGATASVTYTLSLHSNLPSIGYIPLYLSIGQTMHPYYLRLSSAVEDFESGAFNTFNWTQDTYPWTIANSGAYQGSHCAKSGSITHSQSSVMTLNYTSALDDSISFYYKVSSEAGYDKLIFTLDGQEQLQASGAVDWTYTSYFVPAGSHTFVFSYSKDASVSSGSDCAWVDNIRLPQRGNHNHYQLDTICQGESYQLPTSTYFATRPGTYQFADSIGTEYYFTQLVVLAQPNLRLSYDSLVQCGNPTTILASGANRYEWSDGYWREDYHLTPTENTTLSVTGFSGSCPPATASATIYVFDSIEFDTLCVNAEWPQAGDYEITTPHGNRMNYQRLSVIAIPEIAIERLTTTGNELQLSACCAERYLWNTGDTSMALSLPMPDSATLFVVQGWNWQCTAKDSLLVAIDPAGIGSLPEANGICFYPNPTSDEITIIPTPGIIIEIYDLQGKLMLRHMPIDASPQQVSLRSLPAGTYLLRQGNANAKIIITK